MFTFIRIFALLLACGAPFAAAQTELQAERILLTFIPNVQFSPFYVGIDGGYFADAGFDVTLEHLQEPEVLDLVAVQQANFGIVSGEQVILARAQSRDVMYIFEWFQRYPVGLVYDAAAPIEEVADLSGLTIGIPGRFGASYSGFITLLQSGGLSEADVQLNEIGFNAPEAFCLGAVDAAVVYINNEPLQIRNLAAQNECGSVTDVAVASVASAVDLVSNGLIVNRALLDENPDAAALMVSALTQALRAVINNPAAAYLASLPYVENLPQTGAFITELKQIAARQAEFLATSPSRDAVAASRAALHQSLAEQFPPGESAQFQVLLNSVELWDAERLGFSELASWQAMGETLALMGFLDDAEQDLSAAFSNDFLPEREK